jgi:hypothetical protein
MQKKEEIYIRQYMARENDSFCRIEIGKLYGKDLYRIDFHAFGRSSKFNLEIVPTEGPFYGGHLSKKQVKRLVRYLSKLLEQDDAIK